MNKPAAARAIYDFLRAIGRDPQNDPELAGTGERVAEAFGDLCAGYSVDANELARDHVIAGKPGVVMLRDIQTTTMCPHHLMPASGSAIVAYEATDRILGVGALARLVDAFSRRLTLQENIGNEVVQTMMKHLSPRWALCKIAMQHTCMSARGERKHGASLVTLATAGDTALALQTLSVL